VNFSTAIVTEDTMVVQDLTNLKGTFAEYGFDVLYIQMFVQVGTIFSNWFWLVYLAIPGFAVYKLGGYAMMFLGSKYDSPPQAEREYSAEEIKRMEKKQRKFDLQEKRMGKFQK
jgi:hypothetical protein